MYSWYYGRDGQIINSVGQFYGGSPVISPGVVGVKSETGFITTDCMLAVEYIAQNKKSETATILWGGNNETGITTTPTNTLTDNNQPESSNQTTNNSDNSGNNNINNSGNSSSSDEEEEGGEPDGNSEIHIASEVNNNNLVTTDSNTTIGLVTLTGAPVLSSGAGSVCGGNTILQTNQSNPTQGLVHWMSAVMAEHINTNSHHDPTVGMHYMWNGTVDQCGQHNKEIEYGGWPVPRNHMVVKQGYEAKMTDHHNGLQKAHILDDGRLDHHTILQTQMPTAIYSSTGALRTASSNSNSPGIGTHLPGGTPAALLVVPQPINATKISGSTNTTTGGNGTTRKAQTKKKKSTNKRSQVYKSELQLQNQMHLRETKPYKCSQCTKAFANSSYLSQHTRIHLGIKPYRCEICQRKFTQLSHLQQHIRTHTGDKPYKCRHMNCQKAFSQLSNLQSHSRSHQTDKPYKCNSCYKCFQDEPSLLEHIPKHKESKHLKTHICQYCGKSYTQETYLQKHMQKHSERTDKRPPIALGLGINKNINLGTTISGPGDHPYWPKVSPDSATSLAEVMHHQQLQQQQQQQAQQQQQQQQQQQHHDFAASLAQQQTHQNGHVESMQTQHHHQQQQAQQQQQQQQRDEVGEDLVVSRNSGTTINNQQQNNQIPSSTPTGTYDAATTIITSSKTTPNSAFTPIQTMTPHLNTIGHHQLTQRPYLYDAISFQNTKNATVNQNTVNAFPNQLISLHQIRNYAHQPGSIMAGEHILGVSVGPGKDKG